MNGKAVLICLLLCPGFLVAQYGEFGFTGGFSQYIGDLQQGYETAVNHANFGFFGRYNIKRRLAVRGQFSMINLSGSDANQKAFNTFESNRNLHFQSKLFELAALGELNLTNFDLRDGNTTAPYLFGGVAAIYHNPQAQLGGKWYDLQPLGTEGQTLEGGKTYSKINLAIPFGAGLKISINERVNLGFEVGYRITMTDYLDDVSSQYPNLAVLEEQDQIASQLSFRSPEILPQLAGNPVGKPRGNPKDKDGYVIGNITVSINLAKGYDLEFDEKMRKFSPNYKPKKRKTPSLKSVKKEMKKEAARKAKAEKKKDSKVKEEQESNQPNSESELEESVDAKVGAQKEKSAATKPKKKKKNKKKSNSKKRKKTKKNKK